MKISISFGRIAIAALFLSFPLGILRAQITINSEPLTASAFTLSRLQISSFVNPTQGANQTWNYASATVQSNTAEHFYAVTDPGFSTSAIYDTLGFDPLVTAASGQSYGINYYTVYDQSVGGITMPGIILAAQAYNIDSASGENTNDSLWVSRQDDFYSTPENYLALPSTYGTTWVTTNAKRTIDMQVEISKLSLFYPGKTDLKKVSSFSTTDSVVGWGTLMLPGAAGSTKNALLVKSTETRIDSFYLNNAVPNLLILEGFGLAEGMVTATASYQFIVQGSLLPALQITYVPDSGFAKPATMYSYSEAASSVAETNYGTNGVHVYPNPARGKAFFVQFDEPVNNSDRITVVDASGRTVPAEQGALAMGGTLVQISVAPETAAGTYFIRIDRSNGTVEQSKIVIAQ